MTFLIVFLCTVAACCLLRNPVRKAPWVFYLLAVALVVVYLLTTTVFTGKPVIVLTGWPYTLLTATMRKCFLPISLFIIVMYIGVFPKGTNIRRWLQPLRAPLSIIAGILVLGHMIQYVAVYIPGLLAGMAIKTNVAVSLVMAIALFALLAVLVVTSFEFVKKYMNSKSWKNVQRFAYLFYSLVYVHLLIMLGGPALNALSKGTVTQGLISVVIYTVIFGVYLVLRYRRFKTEEAHKAEIDKEYASQYA